MRPLYRAIDFPLEHLRARVPSVTRTEAHTRPDPLGGGVFRERISQMLDLLGLAIGLGFFVLSVGYATACDRL
jgi:hypothetical protein